MLRTAPTWLKALLLGQLVSAAGSLAWLYLTLWLVSARGLGTGPAAAVTAAYGAGAILGNLLGGSFGDRIGMRRALATAKGAALVTCLAFPLCPRPALLPLGLLAGLAGGASRPLMSAVVAGGMPVALRREAIAWSRSNLAGASPSSRRRFGLTSAIWRRMVSRQAAVSASEKRVPALAKQVTAAT